MKSCNHATCDKVCRRPAKPKTLRKRIARNSKKQSKRNREYAAEAKKFLEVNNICLIQGPECTGTAQGVHHIRGRGKYLMDMLTWMPACNACNGYVERHDKWARDNGYKKSRLTNTDAR